jgi:N-ethylmaleimide reductase
MQNLFEPMKLGTLELPNRILMAPLTRGRATDDGTPTEMMSRYYAQRASAGLIIAEATAVSANGRGWMNSPALYNDDHQLGWQRIARKVHNQAGRIFVQLWHMGALVHPDFINGESPLSSSEVTMPGSIRTPAGEARAFAGARAMTHTEIKHVVAAFADSACRAIDAGLDGVEIHAANGFLIDQFLRDSVNAREDEYGGKADNRHRFLLEVIEAVSAAIGSERIGVRISPTSTVWDISDSDPGHNFTLLAQKLNQYDLAYLHVLDPKPQFQHFMETTEYLTPRIREAYQGTLIINGGFSDRTATEALAHNEADAIVFGTPFIANPDLVARYRQGQVLNSPDSNTFYTLGEIGYTDYPALVA